MEPRMFGHPSPFAARRPRRDPFSGEYRAQGCWHESLEDALEAQAEADIQRAEARQLARDLAPRHTDARLQEER